ncbi:hypothetical protein BH23BAC1_BH23BAC1_50860 [soil metagenome]
MAQLSANALFHFTPKIEWLAGILEHGFKPRYCEEFNSDLDDVPGFIDNACIPMTCFCDIPLSSIAKHAKHYGKDIKGGYGIGLRKNSIIMQNLNPVFYFNKSSKIISMLEEIEQHLILVSLGLFDLSSEQNELDGKKIYTKIEDIGEKYLRLMDLRTTSIRAANLLKNFRAYLKPYQNKEGHYKYYDEKEWRYIPDFKLPPFTGKAYSHVDHPFILNMKDGYLENPQKMKADLNESINRHSPVP